MSKNYVYAGFLKRLIAFSIDMLILKVILLPIIGYLLWDDIMLAASRVLETGVYEKVKIPVTMHIFLNLPLFIVTILFWKFKSATPGKIILSLKIVDEDTLGKLTLKQSIIRFFAYIPSTLIFCLGFFWIIWDKKKQSWHDKLSNTVVIKNNPKE